MSVRQFRRCWCGIDTEIVQKFRRAYVGRIVLRLRTKISFEAWRCLRCENDADCAKKSPVQGLVWVTIYRLVANAQLCGYHNLNCVA